ncbi:MAG: D-alanyl-D-alanine carboxypeptidase [Rubrivivax sp.]|nr:D-alanyl-D-alanine carboxypeptidase [Rubrivivax sp.]
MTGSARPSSSLLIPCLLVAGAACAVGAVAAPALPPDTAQALQRAQVPAESIAVVVHDLSSNRRVLGWNDKRSVNPASLTKLVTTMAALERLGPAWTWQTPVWLTGPIKDGVLDGSVFIKGSGDPKLVIERLWLLLRRLQQLGVRDIRGDIVLDSSAFAVPEFDPADFDGEPLRPYNVRASALLFNFRSGTYTFTPDETAGVARIALEPPLAGAVIDRTVPLTSGPCADWRAALKPIFESGRTRFGGSYASACGDNAWPVADPQPTTYDARLIDTLWREMGGLLQGSVRDGLAPIDLKPAFELRSPPLAELVRDINKFSNNLMAQQLFYTLALQGRRNGASGAPGAPSAPSAPSAPGAAGAAAGGAVTADQAREMLSRWLLERTPGIDGEVLLDNGSGLSRRTRLTAERLAALLILAWDSPVMSELMSSLPVSGMDGTMRRSRAAAGRAHLKTGSLRDVAAVAGYVLSNSGRRFAVVAIVNHPNANAARPALEALVQWVLRDTPSR